MKKLIITIFSLLLTVNVLAQRVDYTKPDSLRVVTLMKKAKTLKSKSMASYMLFFGRAALPPHQFTGDQITGCGFQHKTSLHSCKRLHKGVKRKVPYGRLVHLFRLPL